MVEAGDCADATDDVVANATAARAEWNVRIVSMPVLPHLNWRRSRSRSNLAANRAGDRSDLLHHSRELIRIQRLTSVGQRALWIGMHLDDDAVGPRGDCRTTHWGNLVAKTRA